MSPALAGGFLTTGSPGKSRNGEQFMHSYAAWKRPCCWERLKAGREGDDQRMRWLSGIIDSMDKFEQALGDGEGQGSRACYSPWGCKELDISE